MGGEINLANELRSRKLEKRFDTDEEQEEEQQSRSNEQLNHPSERQPNSPNNSIPQGQRNQSSEVPFIDDDSEDFINELGEFSVKLQLYDDDEGKTSFAFHGLAGEVVRAIDPHTEADPVATLMTFLVMFGNIIGDQAHFTAGAREHPARIFATLVGATGKGRKGTSTTPVRLLFKVVDPDWEKNHVLSGMSSGEGLIHAVRDEETKQIPVYDVKGKDKKIIRYDTEVVDQGVTDKRMVVIEEEFGRALRAAKREGNTLSPIIRELWDHGSPRILTKSPIKATGAHVSIIGQITQEELKREINDVDLVNGLANRFLWVMVSRSKLLPSGGEFHKVDVEPLVIKIKAAVEFATGVGELARDKEAHALWEKVYEPLSTGARGIVGAVTSRGEPQVMRLACLYALLDHSRQIKAIHLRAALQLWNYCFKSARFIFGDGAILEHPNAKKLLDELQRLKEEGRYGMTRNEVREFFNRNLSKTELDIIIKELLSNGFIKVDKVKTSLTAKRPTQMITLLE